MPAPMPKQPTRQEAEALLALQRQGTEQGDVGRYDAMMGPLAWLGMDGMPTQQAVRGNRGNANAQIPTPPMRPNDLQQDAGTQAPTPNGGSNNTKAQSYGVPFPATRDPNNPTQPQSLKAAEAGEIAENGRTQLKGGSGAKPATADASYAQIAAQSIAQFVSNAATTTGRSPVDMISDIAQKLMPTKSATAAIAATPRVPMSPEQEIEQDVMAAVPTPPKKSLTDRLSAAGAPFRDVVSKAMSGSGKSMRESVQDIIDMNKYRTAVQSGPSRIPQPSPQNQPPMSQMTAAQMREQERDQIIKDAYDEMMAKQQFAGNKQ